MCWSWRRSTLSVELSVVVFFFYSPSQAGLYRLSGADRTVKELKEKFLRGKTVPVLSRVDDIHAITGLLKDFLRNLKEPLLTFRLNRPFMEAAGTSVWLLLLVVSDEGFTGKKSKGGGAQIYKCSLVDIDLQVAVTS